MKNSLYLLLISAVISSCGTTSKIITSKNEAIKQNQYDANLSNRISSLNDKIATHKLNNDIKYLQKDDDVLEDTANLKMGVDLTEKPFAAEPKTTPYFAYQLIEKAEENLGSPYVTGGISKSGFDCSGLIYATFKSFNYTLPRTANEMSKFGRVLEKNEYRKGDLIFFKTNGRSSINHVGMVIEVLDDEIKFIHSSTNRGVIESSTKESYYGKTFAQINRVVE